MLILSFCVCMPLCVYLCLRCVILAKCRRLTQEILLSGLGVLKTTMKLTGRPDLQENRHAPTQAQFAHAHIK